MPISDVIERIHKETGLSTGEIEGQVKAKVASLKDLVSEEGAAYIVASELGVHLFQEQSSGGPLKIKSILAGLKSVETVGKVLRIFAAKKFTQKDQRQSQVGSLILADETGTIRVVLWDRKADILEKITTGSILKIKYGFSKQSNLGSPELHISTKGTLILDPKGVKIEATSRAAAQKKTIANLAPNDFASVLATAVQIYPVKSYSVCPQCGKKVVIAPEGAMCLEHKTVTPSKAMILNLVLDDGTDTLRAVAFKETAEKLCGLKMPEVEEILAKDGQIILQDRINDFLLGREIDIEGRVKHNVNFDRVELMISTVNLDPNPKQIALSMLRGKNA